MCILVWVHRGKDCMNILSTPPKSTFNALIPELYCSNIDLSLIFYTEILGFSVRYARLKESFAFLEREGAQLMLEQVSDNRCWVIGSLERPYGQGLNLQILTKDIISIYDACVKNACDIYLPLEKQSYQTDERLLTQVQFIVLDPDGYMLRFAQHDSEE